MADQYKFQLAEDGFTVVVVDELGPINTWHTEPESVCLIIEIGIVEQREGVGFICHTGPAGNEPIVTLHGADWATALNSTGDAEIYLGNGCADHQQWTLVERP